MGYRYGDWYFRIDKKFKQIIITNNAKKISYNESFLPDDDCNNIYSLFEDGYTIEELVDEDFNLFIENCEDNDCVQFPSEFWYQLREATKPYRREYYEYYHSRWLSSKEE